MLRQQVDGDFLLQVPMDFLPEERRALEGRREESPSGGPGDSPRVGREFPDREERNSHPDGHLSRFLSGSNPP